MKILNAAQIKSADNLTIRKLPITSINLMEKAAKACENEILKKFANVKKIFIFCGKGNNGADGLAIARLLKSHNFETHVYIIEHANTPSDNFKINLKKYTGTIENIFAISDFNVNCNFNDLIIDALLGNGLNRPLTGLLSNVVEKLNTLAGIKIAIDIPTGLYADNKNESSDVIFKAQHTFVFQTPRLSFLMKENYCYVGDFEILDIGWHPEADKDLQTNYYYTTQNDILSELKKREKFSSKHNFGHALIIAGSYGKTGAALLATKACLKGGAGLTTVYSPKCAYNILQCMAPESMCISDSNNDFISELPPLNKFTAVAVGPGIGLNTKTKEAVLELIQQNELPIVIDADAINIIAENKNNIAAVKPNSVITPHAKEFERLTESANSDFEKLKLAIAFAKKHGIILVLKGAYTAVIDTNDNVYFNSTGNVALAKGGSGDVLTGIIASYLAQGYSPLVAAKLAVFKHGLAADNLIKKQAGESVLATDLIEELIHIYF